MIPQIRRAGGGRWPVPRPAMLAAVLVAALAVASAAAEAPLRLASGEEDGRYAAAARRLLEHCADCQLRVRSSEGSRQNALWLRDERVDLAIMQSDVAYLEHLEGGSYRVLAPLFLEPLHVVAATGLQVDAVDELGRVPGGEQPRDVVEVGARRPAGDRRTSFTAFLGSPGGGTRTQALTVLRRLDPPPVVHTRTPSQLAGMGRTEWKQAFADLRSGAGVDLVFHTSALPSEPLQSQADGRWKLLPIRRGLIRRLRRQSPFLVATEIPHGTYGGQSENVPTVGTRALLVGRRDLAEGQVHRVLTALYDAAEAAGEDGLLHGLSPRGGLHGLGDLTIPVDRRARQWHADHAPAWYSSWDDLRSHLLALFIVVFGLLAVLVLGFPSLRQALEPARRLGRRAGWLLLALLAAAAFLYLLGQDPGSVGHGFHRFVDAELPQLWDVPLGEIVAVSILVGAFLLVIARGRRLSYTLHHRLISRLVVWLAFLWLIGAALMYLVEPPTSLHFNTLGKSMVAILHYLFSGLEAKEPTSDLGQALAIFMLTVGVGAVGLFTSALIERGLAPRDLRRKPWFLPSLDDHVVIVGWTERSRRLLRQLRNPDLPDQPTVVVVSSGQAQVRADHASRTRDAWLVEGDICDQRILREADVPGARTVLVLRDDEHPGRKDVRALQKTLAIAGSLETARRDGDPAPADASAQPAGDPLVADPGPADPGPADSPQVEPVAADEDSDHQRAMAKSWRKRWRRHGRQAHLVVETLSRSTRDKARSCGADEAFSTEELARHLLRKSITSPGFATLLEQLLSFGPGHHEIYLQPEAGRGSFQQALDQARPGVAIPIGYLDWLPEPNAPWPRFELHPVGAKRERQLGPRRLAYLADTQDGWPPGGRWRFGRSPARQRPAPEEITAWWTGISRSDVGGREAGDQPMLRIGICGWNEQTRQLIQLLDSSRSRGGWRFDVTVFDTEFTGRGEFLRSQAEKGAAAPSLRFEERDPTDTAVLAERLGTLDRLVVIGDRKPAQPAADDRSLLAAVTAFQLKENLGLDDLRLLAEVRSSDHRKHFERCKGFEVVAVDDLAEKLLAQTTVSPGITWVYERLLDPQAATGIELRRVPDSWSAEKLTFNDVFHSAVAGGLILPIGVRTVEDGLIRVLLDPADHTFRSADTLIAIGPTDGLSDGTGAETPTGR